MHLAEVAEQLGPPDTLDYAFRLKDCEDAHDHLLRSTARLVKRIGTRTSDIGDTLLAAVGNLAEPNTTTILAAKERTRLLIAANFAVVQWLQFVERHDADLFVPQSIGRHLRYPVNHFMGTLLLDAPATDGPSLRITRVLGLTNLRALVKSSRVADEFPLIRHHAIHMLARYGDGEDRATVQDLILQGLSSGDTLSRKLAFSGLIMAQGAESEIADKYLYELTRDSELAAVDLAFDATHYGDLSLAIDGQLRPLDNFAPMLTQNIVKHYMRPQVYGRLAEIDAFRALSVLDFCRPSDLPAQVGASLISCIEAGVIRPSGGTFQRMLYRNLAQISRSSDPSVSVLASQTSSEAALPGLASSAQYDVFIAYSSDDVEFVRTLEQRLARMGLRCWVDFHNMALGRPHQESMQSGLEHSRACIVVLGNTLGKWQRLESQVAITHFIHNDKPVIPLVIPGSTVLSQLAFLQEFHGILLEKYNSLDLACSEIVANLAAAQ